MLYFWVVLAVAVTMSIAAPSRGKSVRTPDASATDRAVIGSMQGYRPAETRWIADRRANKARPAPRLIAELDSSVRRTSAGQQATRTSVKA